MTDETSIQQQIAHLTEYIAAQKATQPTAVLRTVLPPLEAELTRLKREAASATSTEVGSGANAQGDKATAVGERGVQTEKADFIITGDNNHVTRIIQHVDGMPLNADEMRREIGRYLSWVSNENRAITLQGIQDARDAQNRYVTLDLDTVYVPLQARADPSGEEVAPARVARENRDIRRDIRLDQLLTLGPRLAITGGPGSGKTTVLMHLAWTLATALGQNEAVLAQGKLQLTPPLPLPIFLPINRYADHLRQFAPIERRQRTLAAFISQYLIERQSSLNLPADFFRQLMAQGEHVLLLLDGLDEVPTEAERAQVTQAVQDLVRGHANLRVVVTCRTAAYQGIDQFREVQVQPLTNDHIAQLVTHAYASVYAGSEARQKAQTTDLLDGIQKLEAERRQRLGERAERLITSPLLVRMMLIVHISERRLPNQRAELYLKATENLLAPTYARDVHVQQNIGHMVGGERALEMVQYIAYHMHDRGVNQGREITERELETLLQTHPTCADLTTDFLRLTRARGTVMEAIGEQFRFIHLGFQELLAARYMDEVLTRDHGLHQILGDKLLDSWWREPLLLLPGYSVAAKAPSRAEAVIRYLAGLGRSPLARAERNTQWDAAVLAATAVTEWPDTPRSLRHAVRDRLLALLEGEENLAGQSRFKRFWGQLNNPQAYREIEPLTRAELGMALSQLGDTRPGVGLREDGLPDIAWGGVVPAGTYAIGGDEKAYHSFKAQVVTIAEPYTLAKYPVTYVQFQAFVEAEDFADERWWAGMPERYVKRIDQSPSWPYANHPRVDVSWYEAIAFCRWLSDKLGMEIRLPNEYEWEVAARYGHKGAYPWGNDEIDGNHASYDGNVDKTTAVGLYPAGRQSQLDLYDLSGNVWEWCQNKYKDTSQTQVDASGDSRGLRGGSWLGQGSGARAAYRSDFSPNSRLDDNGFRVVVAGASPPAHPVL